MREARIAGIVMIVLGVAIPVIVFLSTAGAALPYQDPTPAMLRQQAGEVAWADRMLAAGTAVGGVLVLLGMVTLVAARRRRHRADGHPSGTTATGAT